MKQITIKSKWMIFSSLAVSAALIVTVILNIVSGAGTGLAFALGMIALAIAAFALTVAVRLRRAGFVRRLDKSYYAEYERISDALANSVLSRAEIKETKEDILSLMLDAQERGREAEEVTGGDTQVFIRRIQDSFGYRSRFLFQLLSVMQYGVIFVALMQVLVFLEDGGKAGFFGTSIGLSMFVMFLLVILAVYPLIRGALRKDKSVLPFVLPLAFGVAYIAMLELLHRFAYDAEWVRYFLDAEVRMIPSWPVLAALAAAALIAQAAKLLLRKKSVKSLG